MKTFCSPVWVLVLALFIFPAGLPLAADVLDDFDDNVKTDWQDFTFVPGFGLPSETGGQFVFALPPFGSSIFSGSRKLSQEFDLRNGRTIEFRVDLVDGNGADSFAVLAFIPTANSLGTLAGYSVAKSTTDLLLAKGVGKYFYNQNVLPAVKNTNVTLVLTLRAENDTVTITGKVLDKDNGDAVIWEQTAVDTPAPDVLVAGTDDPSPAYLTLGHFALFCYEDFDPGAPQAEYRVVYDNALASAVETGSGPDTDGDGIPDAWEQDHGLDPLDPTDAFRDADGDGVSNLQEFVAGTDPTDPSNRLAFTSLEILAGTVCISYLDGPDVELQQTTFLGNPWTPVPGGGSVYCAPISSARKYYRLRISNSRGTAYSANVVGYSNWMIPGSPAQADVFVEFNQGDNSIHSILPLPPNGTELTKPGASTNYYDDVFGWSEPDMRLPAGTTFRLISPVAFQLTLAGEVGRPTLWSDPRSYAVLAGTNVILSVDAVGFPFDYQWLRNGQPIPGARSNPFLLSQLSLAAAGDYQVVLSNAVGVVTSAVANVSVAEPPVIFQQPLAQTVLFGQSASFRVSAAGSFPLSFLWYRNGNLLTNMTLNQATSILSLTSVPIDGSAAYQVVVTNLAGPSLAVTSAVASLTVLTPPIILVQPGSVTATNGDNVSFCITALGSAPIRFQWRHNGINLAAATNSCLTLTNVQLSAGGAYSVVVENEAGTLISQPALLTLFAPANPPGDNFNDRVSLGTNRSTGIVSGTNAFATKEPGEPNHAGKPGGRSVWYGWIAPASGIATFRTVGSTFDTLLAAYTGLAVTNLTSVAADEDGGGFFTSELQFNAQAGIEYAIAVDGFGGTGGGFILSWNLEPTPESLPVITSQPAGRSVLRGSNATFLVVVSGSGLGYQWFFNDRLLTGATGAELTVSNVQPADVGYYTVRVTNSVGRSVVSAAATLEIGPVPELQSTDKFDDLFLAGSAGRGIRAAATPFLSVAAGLPLSLVMNNTNSTTEPLEPATCAIDGSSRWITLHVTEDSVCVLDTIGSTIDTVLGVYTGQSYLDLLPVDCDDNGAPDGLRSLLRFPAVAGVDYRVRVDGANGVQGVIVLNARVGQPPTASVTPTTATVAAGERVTLSVEALGPGLRYQWRLEGRDLPDGTNATLAVSAVDLTAGAYSVVLINDYGTLVRLVANITVKYNYLASRPVVVNGMVRLTVQRPANQAVAIDAATDLLEWVPLGTVPLTTPGPSVDVPQSGPWRFYRARPWP